MARLSARPTTSLGLLGRIGLGAATAVLLLGLALLVLFLPVWVHFAISAAGGADWLGSAAVAHQLSDRTIGELLFGPATFGFAGPAGAPFYTADEAAHLQDVRLVLFGFLGVVALAGAVLAWAIARHRDSVQLWRAIAGGGLVLAIGLLVVGAFAAVAFGVAFELFHQLLFPGGNWAFPANSNLVRLYPLGFWQLSAAALGVLAVSAGLVTWLLARRRARALESAAGTAS